MYVLDQYVMSAILGNPPFFITDYQLLWQRTAADLASIRVRFMYNADIVRINRRSRGPATMKYTISDPGTGNKRHGNWQRSQKCDKIIAAIPSTTQNLAAFDLSAREQDVFNKVQLVQYFSGAINLPKSSVGRFSRILKYTGEAG